MFNSEIGRSQKIILKVNFPSIEALVKNEYFLSAEVISSGKIYSVDTFECLNSEAKQALSASQQAEIKLLVTASEDNLNELVKEFSKGLPKDVKEVEHAKTAYIQQLLEAGYIPYLAGPAGSGKNYTIEKIAEKIGLRFYYINTVTQEYKLSGYMDANGKFVSTPLYEAMKNGGIFMLDEIDASAPIALTCINAILANGYFTFPNGELVRSHKDFKVIVAGNTAGFGKTAEYAGRSKLDGATLNRFAYVSFGYDSKVEETLVNDKELLAFFNDIRKAKEKVTLPNIIAGLRNMKGIAGMLEKYPNSNLPQLMQTFLYTGEKLDNVIRLIEQCGDKNNKYYKASQEYVKLVKKGSIEIF